MELLVNTVDSSRLQAGDVIVICPDGWPWGTKEIGNPDWRIVRSPILPTLAAALTKHGKERYRDWRLDLSKLPAGVNVDVQVLTSAAVQK